MRRFFWHKNSLNTEITRISAHLWASNSTQIHLIDPTAFFVALIGAPLLVGLLGFPLLIPPFAVLFGGPIYLLAGGPVFCVALQKGLKGAGKFAFLGFALMLGVLFLASALTLVAPYFLLKEWLPVYAIFGLIFAPIWSAVFAALYKVFRNKNYPLKA